MAVPALGLLWILAAVAQPALAAPMGSPEPAQKEELTLLFHGALQLGQALNGVYRTTETRLTEAGDSLGLYGHMLELLEREVSQGQAGARELQRSLLDMQTEEDFLQLQAEVIAQALGQVAQEQQELQDSVQKLEGRLRGTWLGRACQEFETLKARAEEQSHIVWTLTGHVQRQQRELVAQQKRLQQIRARLHRVALPT
ncbi:angiopoietin-like protein 8 [Choloepus didactylus]|uniref:angiopoietin-like protein 8 n=1 Tax=Choloepus didactylus TaxID=27675 RepID=UPI00189EF8E6|nr:angiopoietin-like protein 8 [Choloepus didactylus]